MYSNLHQILEMRKKQLKEREQNVEEVDCVSNKDNMPSPSKKGKELDNLIKKQSTPKDESKNIRKRTQGQQELPESNINLVEASKTNRENVTKNVNKKSKVQINSIKKLKLDTPFVESTSDLENKISVDGTSAQLNGNKKKSERKDKKTAAVKTRTKKNENPRPKGESAPKKTTTAKKKPSPKKANSNNDMLDSNSNAKMQNGAEPITEIKEEPPELVEMSDQDEVIDISHSVLEGKKLFSWLIDPISAEDFFQNTWEKKPLHVKRNVSEYYKNVLSTAQIDQILRYERLEFTKNVDITSYTDGKRETHNPVGRALPAVVWDFYSNGCSIRILNPQAYIPKLHLLCATLQEFFGCMVGTNSYLTPPGSQGFAPHYDDIEAFVIQVEGSKHWKLYSPREQTETLPRTSSTNFTREEIGTPIMEVTLNQGDILYFPRGTIHEASTAGTEHSLHVTISMYQKHSWADLLEKVIPCMIATAVSENTSLREGLPLDISNHLGLIYSDRTTIRRIQIISQLKEMISKMIDHASFDAAVDQMCKEFQHSALPPVLTQQEISCTVFGDGEVMKAKGVVENRVEMGLDTKIRLLRANIIRMIMEEEVIRIYYYVDNTKEYKAVEPQFMEVEEGQAPAIEFLILSYPTFVSISEIPLETSMEKVNLVQTLWEKGLLITSKPLDVLED